MLHKKTCNENVGNGESVSFVRRQEFIRRINNTFIGLKQDKDEIWSDVKIFET